MIKADLKRFGASGAFLYLGGAAEARALLTAEADEIMPRPTTSVGISVGFTTCDTKCGRVETFEWVGLVVRMVVVAGRNRKRTSLRIILQTFNDHRSPILLVQEQAGMD